MKDLIRYLPPNTKGRDFIIGDLHGCYGLLMAEMEKNEFNKETDRLFSVGDLTDRGPDSLRCAELVYEPWFYAVYGNHDRMMFTYFLGTHSLEHTSTDFIHNGGIWARFVDQSPEEMQILCRDMMERMSYAIVVEGKFQLTHAYWSRVEIAKTNSHNLDGITWDRKLAYLYKHALQQAGIREKFMRDIRRELVMLSQYDPSRLFTYVGHNILANGNNVFIDDHYMLDSGAYNALPRYDSSLSYIGEAELVRDHNARLTMVDHEKVVEALLEGNKQFEETGVSS